ncbi:hypothetical protein GJ699_03370 [Duganella sp. FT80W]|uniref:Uncharacterized protein n=1 Tax=Duganella guangzhouensis TaxID=2666084 RepID=A0A6I2KXU3_9BURK|nr:hypothetical protein [Duganella guangzhouensis]MRW89016.1 hypothetical protein [Duganella guangzhouensis]
MFYSREMFGRAAPALEQMAAQAYWTAAVLLTGSVAERIATVLFHLK